MLPGEGADTDYPILRLSIDIVLGGRVSVLWDLPYRLSDIPYRWFSPPDSANMRQGVLCGLAGGTWDSQLHSDLTYGFQFMMRFHLMYAKFSKCLQMISLLPSSQKPSRTSQIDPQSSTFLSFDVASGQMPFLHGPSA